MLNKLLTFIVVIEIILLVIINPVIKKTIKYKYSINTYKVSDIDKAKVSRQFSIELEKMVHNLIEQVNITDVNERARIEAKALEANLIEDCEKELTKRGSKVWIEGTLVNKRHERKNLLINAA